MSAAHDVRDGGHGPDRYADPDHHDGRYRSAVKADGRVAMLDITAHVTHRGISQFIERIDGSHASAPVGAPTAKPSPAPPPSRDVTTSFRAIEKNVGDVAACETIGKRAHVAIIALDGHVPLAYQAIGAPAPRTNAATCTLAIAQAAERARIAAASAQYIFSCSVFHLNASSVMSNILTGNSASPFAP